MFLLVVTAAIGIVSGTVVSILPPNNVSAFPPDGGGEYTYRYLAEFGRSFRVFGPPKGFHSQRAKTKSFYHFDEMEITMNGTVVIAESKRIRATCAI